MREKLAALQHEIWAHWMKYMISCCSYHMNPAGNMDMIIPQEKVQRWCRQIDTLYADLPEGEKDSDRDQADKIFKLLREK